jgi:hypothetical protein
VGCAQLPCRSHWRIFSRARRGSSRGEERIKLTESAYWMRTNLTSGSHLEVISPGVIDFGCAGLEFGHGLSPPACPERPARSEEDRPDRLVPRCSDTASKEAGGAEGLHAESASARARRGLLANGVHQSLTRRWPQGWRGEGSSWATQRKRKLGLNGGTRPMKLLFFFFLSFLPIFFFQVQFEFEF